MDKCHSRSAVMQKVTLDAESRTKKVHPINYTCKYFSDLFPEQELNNQWYTFIFRYKKNRERQSKSPLLSEL